MLWQPDKVLTPKMSFKWRHSSREIAIGVQQVKLGWGEETAVSVESFDRVLSEQIKRWLT